MMAETSKRKKIRKPRLMEPSDRRVAYRLDARRLKFARYYPTARSGREAAIKAGFSPKYAAASAAELLRNPEVQKAIETEIEAHCVAIGLQPEKVMKYWYDIATAELPLPDAGACRYCYGVDNRKQYTQDEYREARIKHIRSMRKLERKERVPFDEMGSPDNNYFDKTLPPSPDCPECNGVGVNHPMVIDRRKLSAAQRAAIDEVRVHKDGSVSLKMRDRSRAMENLQEILGIVRRRKPLEVLAEDAPFEEAVDVLLQTAMDRGLLPRNSEPLTIDNEPEPEFEPTAESDAE